MTAANQTGLPPEHGGNMAARPDPGQTAEWQSAAALLAGFFPGQRLLPTRPGERSPAGQPGLRRPGDPATRAGDSVATEGPFAAPAFGPYRAPLALVVAEAVADGPLDPVAIAAARAAPLPEWDVLAACRAACPGMPDPALAGLLAATRWVDPFQARPWTAAEGLAQLLAWRAEAAARAGIAATVGMEVFKRARMRLALAGEGPPPRDFWRASAAIAHARRQGGAVAVWAATMPEGLPAQAAAAGVPLIRLEDGFLRSAGLGVNLVPAAGLVRDRAGIHFDARTPSELESLLAQGDVPPALLARAARLRAAILAADLTTYNRRGTAPPLALPPGRRVILVPGQVEDDAAVLRSGAALRRNLDLLRAVRAANPDAVLLYKPHPDVVAGMRRGRIPPAEAARLADHVLPETPIAALYPLVQEVHTIGSLAGFEALLRGLRVVTYGRPFYAGWGLTEDRDPPPRRGRAVGLDALVAAALILYQRSTDPVTGLPCEPEVLAARLAEAAPPAARPASPAWARALVARASRTVTGWLARG